MPYDINDQDKTILRSYLPTSLHDWLLIDLWGQMQRDGSLESAMLPNAQGLLPFCTLLAKPTTRFAFDTNGPYFCLWVEPLMYAASLGLWIREDYRQSRLCLTLAHEALSDLFQHLRVLIVITRDPRIQRFHAHFGFTSCGDIPYAYGGDTAYISFLTRDDYQAKYQSTPPQETPPPSQDDITSYILSLGKE